jgi:NAD(P)-dependent dehydrogenase (short-subunit alcohol dehydrogenase family)
LQELVGKTAFVTGAASGIGFALSRTFAEAGVKVMLADIEWHRQVERPLPWQSRGDRISALDDDVPRSALRRLSLSR